MEVGGALGEVDGAAAPPIPWEVPTSIRIATIADSDLIRDLGIRIFSETFGPLNTPENMRAYLDEAFSPERVRAEISDPGSTHFVAESDGAAAGYARLRAGDAPPGTSGEQPVELVRLYVDRAHHGSGVAAALTQACLSHARDGGHDVVYLGVWEHNPRAVAFYRKWGFEQFGEHAFMLGDDEQTDWLMRRDV
jgi:ribosomal protein S18 acetylase RimI-like enzyme